MVRLVVFACTLIIAASNVIVRSPKDLVEKFGGNF